MDQTSEKETIQNQAKLICGLRFCSLADTSIRFETSGTHLIQGTDYLYANIFTERLCGEIGNIHLRQFINNPFFFRTIPFSDETDMLIRMRRVFSALGHFLSFLWFSRDNCVDLGHIYTYPAESGGAVVSQFRPSTTSLSNGEHYETILKIEDLQTAEKVLQRIFEVQDNNTSSKSAPPAHAEFEKAQIVDSNFYYRDYNEHNRIQRAMSFLNMARSTSFLPLKISIYMAVLETLYTTDKIEVNYKVCQRVAFYIGGDHETKMGNFKKVKDAYDIRSSFFHGQELGKNRDDRAYLAKISAQIDELLRVILTKVLFTDTETFLKDNNSMTDYYNRLVFQ